MQTDFRRRFGRNLRNIRVIRDLSAEDISDRLGITVDAVYKYERGDRAMSLENIYWYAALLGADVQEFLDGLDARKGGSLPALRRPIKGTSADTHENLRWLSSEWDGDVDALVTMAAMVARWPVERRRELYMDLSIENEKMLAAGQLDPADQPAGTPHMLDGIGALYRR